MIPEKVIEAAAESIGTQNEQGYDRLINDFKSKQPIVLAYLFSDNLKLLTDPERNLLLYIALVIRKSYLKVNDGQEPPPITEDEISDAEEKNWMKLDENPKTPFRQKLDVYFKQTPQEELLAFVEDLLTDEEEDIVSKPAREYIFITAKTIIDIWC